MTGLRKAAIILQLLGKPLATEVLGRLRTEHAQALSQEMEAAANPDHTDREAVIEEFCRHVWAGKSTLAEPSAQFPEKSNPAAELKRDAAARHAFARLHDVSVDRLADAVSHEHPQTAAVVLSQLPVESAAGALARMSESAQFEVVRRMASLGDVSPQVVDDIAQTLLARLNEAETRPAERPQGLAKVARVLDAAGASTNQAILDRLANRHADLARLVRQEMLSFEDLRRLDDASAAALLEEASPGAWVLALKGASFELRARILKLLPRRWAENVKDELDDLGPVRVSDVENAQRQIMATLGRLSHYRSLVPGANGLGAGSIDRT